MPPAATTPIRFATKSDAVAWINEHALDCWAHDGGRGWIAVALTPQGVCAATSPTTGIVLRDW